MIDCWVADVCVLGVELHTDTQASATSFGIRLGASSGSRNFPFPMTRKSFGGKCDRMLQNAEGASKTIFDPPRASVTLTSPSRNDVGEQKWS